LFKLDKPNQRIKNGTWYVEVTGSDDDETTALEEGFITDAFLRYGCDTEPFMSRDILQHDQNRSLCTLKGLEEDVDGIANLLEDAIRARNATSGRGKKRKSPSSEEDEEMEVEEDGDGEEEDEEGEEEEEEQPKPKKVTRAKAKPKPKAKAATKAKPEPKPKPKAKRRR
jgi:hypothetical protein